MRLLRDMSGFNSGLKKAKKEKARKAMAEGVPAWGAGGFV
jgi:hypothetical protein